MKTPSTLAAVTAFLFLATLLCVEFTGGEHHAIRDYVAETGQYTVLKTEAAVDHPLQGFQVVQGPGGIGAVVMELTEADNREIAENWITVYDGKAWSPAVKVTTMKELSALSYKATGTRSSVTTVGRWSAGPSSAAAFDSQNHLLFIHEADQFGNFALSGGGATAVGGGTESLSLLFHHFYSGECSLTMPKCRARCRPHPACWNGGYGRCAGAILQRLSVLQSERDVQGT